MKFLFVHQNFPGQFLHIVRHLVAMGGHEIVFITEPNQNALAGVRKVPYLKPRPSSADTHVVARELDVAVRRAEIVAHTAATLKDLGFVPDIVIGHQGWGEMLNLCDVWPGVPIYGYMEFFYRIENSDVSFDPEFPNERADFPRIRGKNGINHLALDLPGHFFTPTRWQWSTYPEWARKRIDLLWEGVNLDVCAPDPKARRAALKIGGATIGRTDTLVTFVARDLEPYRGAHIMMRALPALMKARPKLKVVMVGGDGVSYGALPPPGETWRDRFLNEVKGQIDRDRLVLPGRVDYETYTAMLKRSDAHVYLTYPFVASWSLREALAMGCAVIGSDTAPVTEFVTNGKNGVTTSFFDPKGLAGKVLEVLENKALNQKIRAGARDYAEKNLRMEDYLAAFVERIETLTGKTVAPARPARVRARPRARVGAKR